MRSNTTQGLEFKHTVKNVEGESWPHGGHQLSPVERSALWSTKERREAGQAGALGRMR